MRTLICLIAMLSYSPAFAALPMSINDREYGKFVEDASGNVTVRGTLAAGSVLANTGNVGIGTSDTTKNQLTVNGAVGVGTANSAYVRTTAPAGGMLIEGNVGIGSLTPRGKLDLGTGLIYGDGSALINLPGGSNYWALSPGNVGINTTLNVGIGSVSPNRKLVVAGNVSVGTTDTNRYNLKVNNNVTFQSVYQAGNVGLGTTTLAWDNGTYQNVGMGTATGGKIAFTYPAAGVGKLVVFLTQDSAGSKVIQEWPNTTIWRGGTAPTLTTTANKKDIWVCTYDGTNSYCDVSLNY